MNRKKWRIEMRPTGLLVGIALLCPHYGFAADLAPEAASGLSAVKTTTARRYMAATANPHATEAALAMLAKGGSAVDAAIAAQLVLGLVEPQSSGLGGGAFLLYWNSEKNQLTYLDGRETAPAALTAEHFLKPDGSAMGFFDAVIGGHAVGVPGVPALLEEAHNRGGKLRWKELFGPAIDLAAGGFEISPRLHTLLKYMPKVAVNPKITEYFFQADGRTPKPAGTVLTNPAYAATLTQLSKKGAEDFYNGALARQIVTAVGNDPNRRGQLNITDMQSYRAVERDAVCGNFRRYVVCGAAPPSSGGTTVIAILGALALWDTATLSEPDRIHLFSEASRLAFADRNTWVGDPDFVSVPTKGLVNAAYLAKRAASMQLGKRSPAFFAGNPDELNAKAAFIPGKSPELNSTSHLSIVDAEGNIVSMTTSIEFGFGSRVMAGGFLLNNQLTDFSFTPRDGNGDLIANRVQPGKRPRSSMAPVIVFEDGKPVLALGSPGGARIIDYVARTLWDVLDRNVPLSEAVAAPHYIDMGKKLELEAGGFDDITISALAEMGHEVKESAQTSGLHGFQKVNGVWHGAADPRREGTVGGE